MTGSKKPRALIQEVKYNDEGKAEKVTVKIMDTGMVTYGNEIIFTSLIKYLDFYQATKKSLKWINPGVV